MTEDERGDDPLSRPLPSVKIPLLREERRANRIRQLVLVGSVGAVAIGSVALLVVWAIQEDAPDADEVTELQPPVASPDEEFSAPEPTTETEQPATVIDAATPSGAIAELEPVGQTTTAFGQARSFREALIRAQLSREECNALEEVLGEVVDFRRCRPEDRLVVVRDPAGALTRFEYHGGSPTEYVAVTRSGDRWVAREVERPIRRVRLGTGGTVQTSLGDALVAAGLRRSIIGAFLEAFDGRINFSTQSRAGDTFRVVVDEEYLEDRFLRYGTVHALEYVGERTGRTQAFWFEPRGAAPDFFDSTGHSVRGGWLRTPLRYDRISSRFDPHRLHPILRRVQPHNGVDYAAATGTPVYAAAAGTISWAGPKGPNGNLVSIRHEGGYETFYAHLSRIAEGIRRGAQVSQRQHIGDVGTTGRSTGPHLHFGLKLNGAFVDPLVEINGPGRMMPAGNGNQTRFRHHVRSVTTELERIDVGRETAPSLTPPENVEADPEHPMD